MTETDPRTELHETGPRPTWRRRWTAGLRALPAFVVVGTNRGGTTSLFRWLAQHPRVVPSIRKEIHFFDVDEHWARGEAWYRGHFPRRARLARSGAVTYEATPGYMFFEHVPGRMAALLPDARLIALLRDPVERAYSSHRKSCDQGRQRATFEDEVLHELARERGEAGPLGDARPGTLLARGRYAEQLERFFQHFPRERVLVLESTGLFRDPLATTAAVLRFLELEPHPIEARAHNASPRGAPLSPALRERLARYFAPHDRRLAELLGVELSWTEAAERGRSARAGATLEE